MKFLGKSVIALISLSVLGGISQNVYASNIDNTLKTGAKDICENSSNNDIDAKKYLKADPIKGPGLFDSRVSTSAATPFDKYGSSLIYFGSHQAFLNGIKSYCVALKAKGLLPSVAAAQAILESGWGGSTLSTNYNNYFGITGSYHGNTVNMPTREFYGGQYHYMNRYFRSYPSLQDCFDDYANILISYGNIQGVKSYQTVASRLQGKYATDPNYARSIINTIQANGLEAWDNISGSIMQESEKIAQIVYTPGYGVLSFNNLGKSINGSNLKFKNGTKWKTFGSKIINGEEMYLVGNNEYVPKRYTNHYDNGIITIHYVPNYGVNAIRADGSQIIGSNKIFKTGTRWKIVSVKEINGEICYCVGNDEYIPKHYTQWGTGK